MLARRASADGKACTLPPWRSRAPLVSGHAGWRWRLLPPRRERRQLRTARWKTIADITSPMKRRDPGLPLVTCHGFSPPTFLHQGLALRASVPAITEAIRPGVAGPLSWSCGWHDRRKRQGTGVITDDGRSSDPSVSHQAPYRASRGRAGLCLRSPSRFSRASDLAGMSDWTPVRLAEPHRDGRPSLSTPRWVEGTSRR
jgi:hypothetical protein